MSETVRVGQVWKDWDSRYRNQIPGRCLRVIEIDGDYAICETVTDDAYAERTGISAIGKRRRIKISRMRPTSSGYKLIEEEA